MKYTTLSSGATYTFKCQAYRCPVHGIVDDGTGTVNLSDSAGNLTSKHCMKCYQEWIRANIPQVEDV